MLEQLRTGQQASCSSLTLTLLSLFGVYNGLVCNTKDMLFIAAALTAKMLRMRATAAWNFWLIVWNRSWVLSVVLSDAVSPSLPNSPEP